MKTQNNIKNIVKVLNEAIALQRKGQAVEAEERYQAILAHEGRFKETSSKDDRHHTNIFVKVIFSQVYNNLGLFREKENKLGQAISNFRYALDYAPGSVEAYTNLARVFFKKRNLEKALESAKKAVDLQPDYLPAVIQLCRVAYVLDMPEIALTALEKVGNKGQKNARFNVEYGRILGKLGRRQEAREKYAVALALAPKNIYALRNMGDVNFYLGQYGEALKNYHRILEINPEYNDVYRHIGLIHQRMGQFNKAENAYRQALSANPADTETLASYALLKELWGDYEGALEVANTVLNTPKIIQSVQIMALLVSAKCLRNLGDPEAAVEKCQEILLLSRHPDDTHHAYYEMGLAYDSLGKEGEAFKSASQGNEEFLKMAASFQDDKKSLYTLLNDLLDEDYSTMFPEGHNLGQAKHFVPPIFVVGTILSGAKLLDHFFQDFEDFKVLQEAPFINGLRRRLIQEEGVYPTCLKAMPIEKVKRLQGLYFDLQNQFMPEMEGKVIWNSYPLNLLDIPLILKLFPQARFIFVGCNPVDTVLNCFMKSFVLNETSIIFADLKKTADFTVQCLNLWEKFKSDLPISYAEVRYENLLRSPARELQKLLKFIDPDGRTTALKRLKKAKNLKTIADEYQKNYPPLRWKRYENFLRPCLKVVQPYSKKLGY